MNYNNKSVVSVTMYCWGSTVHGELGLGGIEEEQILTPKQLTWSNVDKVTNVACGENHTLLLTRDGEVYSCGSNDYGQLGHMAPRKRPRKSCFGMCMSIFSKLSTSNLFCKLFNTKSCSQLKVTFTNSYFNVHCY